MFNVARKARSHYVFRRHQRQKTQNDNAAPCQQTKGSSEETRAHYRRFDDLPLYRKSSRQTRCATTHRTQAGGAIGDLDLQRVLPADDRLVVSPTRLCFGDGFPETTERLGNRPYSNRRLILF